MVRQYAAVQHVGIGKNNMALLTDGFSGVGRSIAVISENAERLSHLFPNVLELGKLILSQRLRGKDVQCAGVRIFQNCI